MAIERMTITPEVLTWARQRAGYKLDDLSKKSDFKKIAAWESGDLGPTYRQLEKLANTFKVPLIAFFLPEPPNIEPIETTFRTLGSEQFDEIPPPVRLLLHKARAFQLGLGELNEGRNPAAHLITRDLALSVDEPPEEAAVRVRKLIGVTLEDQFGWRDEDTALKTWRSAFYRVGVTVFKDAFGAEEYCGFSLYDSEFPVIYVNNSFPKTRQIFTLFHEVGHLLFHTSGVDMRREFRIALPSEYSRLESQCNALAGAVLVPDDALDKELRAEPQPRLEAERLSKKFSVSREVIYRKFLNRELISQSEYQTATSQWADQRSNVKRNGGNFYRTRIAYLGEEYIALAFRRYYEDRIDEEELANYLAVKPKQIDPLEETFFGNADDLRFRYQLLFALIRLPSSKYFS